MTGGLSASTRRKVLDHMRSHLTHGADGELHLARLAELANLSEFHFARMFRLSMGCSVHVWVVQQRMALAGRLLNSSPTLSMACVAVSSGFGSASHLNRAFKQHLGVMPLQFRLATAGMRHCPFFAALSSATSAIVQLEILAASCIRAGGTAAPSTLRAPLKRLVQ